MEQLHAHEVLHMMKGNSYSGKFMSTDEGFTVDITKVCNH